MTRQKEKGSHTPFLSPAPDDGTGRRSLVCYLWYLHSLQLLPTRTPNSLRPASVARRPFMLRLGASVTLRIARQPWCSRRATLTMATAPAATPLEALDHAVGVQVRKQARAGTDRHTSRRSHLLSPPPGACGAMPGARASRCHA